jgi:hypothetical protein
MLKVIKMANPTPQNFSGAAAKATIEASRSREQLGRDLAALFMSAPATFDPVALRRLGQAGLRSFAAALGVSAPTPPSPVAEAKKQTVSEDETNWKHQESRIVQFQVVGAFYGAIAGLTAIVAVSLLSALLS